MDGPPNPSIAAWPLGRHWIRPPPAARLPSDLPPTSARSGIPTIVSSRPLLPKPTATTYDEEAPPPHQRMRHPLCRVPPDPRPLQCQICTMHPQIHTCYTIAHVSSHLWEEEVPECHHRPRLHARARWRRGGVGPCATPPGLPPPMRKHVRTHASASRALCGEEEKEMFWIF